MAVDLGIELRRGELAFEHVALELGHVDAVGGEAAQRLVERRRQVADAEHEGRHDRLRSGRRPLRRLGQDDEAGGVVRLVLDVLGQDLQAVDVGRHAGRERRPARILPLRHLARGAGGVAGHMRLQPELADDLAALAQRMDVAVDVLDGAEIGLGDGHQMEMDRQEVLADDVQPRGRQQMVDVGDTARRSSSRSGSWRGPPGPRSRRRRRPRRSGRAAASQSGRASGRRCGNWRPSSPWKAIACSMSQARAKVVRFTLTMRC